MSDPGRKPKTRSSHVSAAELDLLLFGDESCAELAEIMTHVESCEMCRRALDELSGTGDFDSEVSNLLSSGIDEPKAQADLDGLLDEPSHPELLGRLGRYEVERVVGRGGMGVVFKAFDTELNRTVALKVLSKHLAHVGAARQRFAREAKAAAAVIHENVLPIHNVETETDVMFLVMPFVAGESLQARVRRKGALDAKEVLRIGMQTAAGLQAAHDQGVVHRDIKPANILLEGDVDRALVTDFGLAQTIDDASLTNSGFIAGTPNYMSPEQAKGLPTTHRTDLFSLGCVLYFAAAGRPPFRAENSMAVLNRVCHEAHTPLWKVNPEIPDDLSDLVDRLLSKNPASRFASAGTARARLLEILARLQHAKPEKWVSIRRMKRKVGQYWKPALKVVALIAGGLLIWILASNSNRVFGPNDSTPSTENEVEILTP